MNMKMLCCYIAGQHEYGVQCEPGEIFLRCIHCGRRSAGWEVKTTKSVATRMAASAGKQDATASNKKRPARSTSPVAASV